MLGRIFRNANGLDLPRTAATWSFALFTAVSIPTTVVASGIHCPAKQAKEQSAVVTTGKLDRAADNRVALTAALQPIASISDYDSDFDEPSSTISAAVSKTITAQPTSQPEISGIELPDPAAGTRAPLAVEAAIETAIETAVHETSPKGKSVEPAVIATTPDDATQSASVEPTTAGQADTIEPASFYGATPGVTTRDELLETWGETADGDTDKSVLAFEMPSFPRITVRLENNVVVKIRVELEKPFVANSLAQRLHLAQYDTQVRTNAQGSVVSTTYPERGVTFQHQVEDKLADAHATDASATDDLTAETKPSQHYVQSLIVQTIQADHFYQRALQRHSRSYTKQVTDLETALTLDADLAPAKVELSRIALKMGRPVIATTLATEAAEQQPHSADFLLQLARCQTAAAQYDLAVESCNQLLASTDITRLQRAQTLHQIGLLSALGSKEVGEQTIPLHNKAIALADEVATDSNPAIAEAAGQILVDSHLAIASAIATGEWQDKEATVAQWISRASGLAEKQIEANTQQLPLRLQVAVEALAVGAKLNPPIDPKLWVAEVEETVEQLSKQTTDVSAREEYQWQLGLAYYYATEIQHRRGKQASALRYGHLAKDEIAPLAKKRAEGPDTHFVLGRLYFQIGAIHAVHRDDHDLACEYYDKAAPLLLKPAPVTKFASPGRHADALVSMGVSYWHVGQRGEAFELTKSGADLVEQGISEGLLETSARSVPASNLAAMDRAINRVETPAIVPTPGDTPQQIARRQGNKRTASKPQSRNQQSRTQRR